MSRRVRSGRTMGNRARLRVRGCKVSTYRGCRFRAVAAPLNASFFGHSPPIPRFRADSRRGASVRSGARMRHGPSIGGGWRGGATRWARSRTSTGAGCRCRVPCRVWDGRGMRGTGCHCGVRGAFPRRGVTASDSARPSPARPPPPCRARPGTDRPPILPSDPRTRPTVRLATSVQVRS